MKKLILSALVGFSAFATADLQKKSFDMKYEVISAKAVCFAICASWDCEESNFEMFYDFDTFKKLDNLDHSTHSHRHSAYCEESHHGDDNDNVVPVTYVSENMLKLAKQDAKAAAKIVAEQGTTFQIVIHERVDKKVRKFVQEVLDSDIQ